MKVVPENKTFLYIVTGLILLLAVFQIAVTHSHPSGLSGEASDFGTMRKKIAREKVIRERHLRLLKEKKLWEDRFLPGDLPDVEMQLLKRVQGWAACSGLAYDSVRLIPVERLHDPTAVLALQGKGTFAQVGKFLDQAEHSDFCVSVSGVRLRKLDNEGLIHYELRVTTPVLGRGRG